MHQNETKSSRSRAAVGGPLGEPGGRVSLFYILARPCVQKIVMYYLFVSGERYLLQRRAGHHIQNVFTYLHHVKGLILLQVRRICCLYVDAIFLSYCMVVYM